MRATRRSWKHYWMAALIGIAAVLLAACAAEEATPTTAPPTPTPTPVVGATPTPTPVAEAATPTPEVVGEQPQYGGILRLWTRREPGEYDPTQSGTIDLIGKVGGIYDTLVRQDRKTGSVSGPHLAESWETSGDGLTWTFYLHKNVQWHDGVPFTSADVVYTYERFFNPLPHMKSPRKATLPTFQRVYALDDYTVAFDFGLPEADVAGILGNPLNSVLPKHIVEPLDVEGKYLGPDAIGTGPFKFVKFRRESLFEVERNPDYWKEGLPYLDGMRFATGRERATMFAAFRTGRIDVTARGGGMPLTKGMVDIVEKMPDAYVDWSMMGTGAGFAGNVQMAPFDDIRVRKAINLVIDRDFVCQAALEGLCSPPEIWLQAGHAFGFSEEEIRALPGYRQPKDQDIAEAQRLMVEAGFPNGFSTVTDIYTPSVFMLVGEVLTNELAKIKIEMKIHAMDKAEHDGLLASCDYQSIVRGHADRPWSINYSLPGWMSNSGGEIGCVRDPKLDDMLTRQSTTVDPAKRREVVREAIQYIYDNAYFAYGARDLRVAGVHTWVKNLILPGYQWLNNDYEDVWLTQSAPGR